jgi:hypothetical protein
MALPDHPDFSGFTLGRQHEPVEVDTAQAVREASLALIAGAQQEVVLFSRHLDAPLYDNAETNGALREFVLQSRRTRVRILVKDPAPVTGRGHRLLDLAQRLSTYVEIRVPAPEYHAANSAYLVVDRTGLVYRGLADRYEATVAFADRQMAGELMRQFEEMWETSRSDPGLRRMAL